MLEEVRTICREIPHEDLCFQWAYHEWWYYPLMTRDEVVLIMQWDSAGGLAQSGGVQADSSAGNCDAPCTFSFHTAFRDPNTPTDAPDRQSIEVRCVAFFD